MNWDDDFQHDPDVALMQRRRPKPVRLSLEERERVGVCAKCGQVVAFPKWSQHLWDEHRLAVPSWTAGRWFGASVRLDPRAA